LAIEAIEGKYAQVVSQTGISKERSSSEGKVNRRKKNRSRTEEDNRNSSKATVKQRGVYQKDH